MNLLDNGDLSVLDNDTDLDGDTLTASLVVGVEFGPLVFNEDGSFSYQHHGANEFSDSFTYIANDGLEVACGAVVIEIVQKPFEEFMGDIYSNIETALGPTFGVQGKVGDEIVVDTPHWEFPTRIRWSLRMP